MTGRVVGFTGTREGMTVEQRRALEDLLIARSVRKLRHGVCVGADSEAHSVCIGLGIIQLGHPGPAGNKFMGDCTFRTENLAEPKEFLERDRDIVNDSEELIAAPKERGWEPTGRGSGTWYTIRYARSQRKRVFIIWPNGTVTQED